MAKGFFAYLPALMRRTYHGWTADFTGWEAEVETMTSTMARSEIEVMIDEVDQASEYSDTEEDLRNFVRSIGAVEFPIGCYRDHFLEIRQVLASKLEA